MKHLKFFFFVALLITAGNTFAQTKIGYIRIDDIVGLMPEVQKVNLDTVGQKFVQDSIVPQLQKMQSDLEAKEAQLQDTVKNTKQVRQIIWQEYIQLKQQLDNSQSVVQQIMQAKQNEFLAPFYEKARKAIESVAKEKGYTHVMAPDVFIVAPEGDNISLAVVNKLGLKIPDQNRPVAPATKPAAAPAPKAK